MLGLNGEYVVLVSYLSICLCWFEFYVVLKRESW